MVTRILIALWQAPCGCVTAVIVSVIYISVFRNVWMHILFMASVGVMVLCWLHDGTLLWPLKASIIRVEFLGIFWRG